MRLPPAMMPELFGPPVAERRSAAWARREHFGHFSAGRHSAALAEPLPVLARSRWWILPRPLAFPWAEALRAEALPLSDPWRHPLSLLPCDLMPFDLPL